MMALFTNKRDCYGCGACASVCPRGAIKMVHDKHGFLYPVIDPEKCIDCHLCNRVCQIGNEVDLLTPYPKTTYAVKNEDENRSRSSSGGAFTALSDSILKSGGLIVGAAYDESMCVRHRVAGEVASRDSMRGSKYVQSDISNVFNEYKNLSGKKVLFTGTPCQIAAFKLVAKLLKVNSSNWVYADLVCHGAPSPTVWGDYVRSLEKKQGSRLVSYSFRNKDAGWRGYHIRAEFEDGSVLLDDSSEARGFAVVFSKSLGLRPSCYHCPYSRMQRVGDLTIADYWGIEKDDPEFSDNVGVSMVFVNSEQGETLLTDSSERLTLKEETETPVQRNLHNSTDYPQFDYDSFWTAYENGSWGGVASRFGYVGKSGKLYRLVDKVKTKVRRA